MIILDFNSIILWIASCAVILAMVISNVRKDLHKLVALPYLSENYERMSRMHKTVNDLGSAAVAHHYLHNGNSRD